MVGEVTNNELESIWKWSLPNRDIIIVSCWRRWRSQVAILITSLFTEVSGRISSQRQMKQICANMLFPGALLYRNDYKKHEWTWENCVRFEVFTALTMKDGVFWVVTPCGSCRNWRFGGTWRLLHQGDKNRWTRNNTSFCLTEACVVSSSQASVEFFYLLSGYECCWEKLNSNRYTF
jgi:hypothetical protein